MVNIMEIAQTNIQSDDNAQVEWGRPSQITAIVLNYNYARFLKDAIESLISQEQPFNEVIVVNDGSIDNSLDIISAYSQQVTILNIENRGQLGAAIAGLELVKSEYVYFLDADDYVEQGFTKRLFKYIQASPAKIQFQLNGVDGDRNPLSSVFPAYPAGYNAEQMRQDNQCRGFYICPPTSGNVYRVGSLRSLRLSELNPRDFIDGTPVLVMPYLGEVLSVPEALANYRVHGANDSQYFHPTPELLAKEISMLRRRWNEAALLIHGLVPPEQGETLMELESGLAAKALGEGVPYGLVCKYVRRLTRSNEAPRRKIVKAGWAVSLYLLPMGLRRRVVFAERSSVNRSKKLRAVIRWVLGT